MVIMAEVSRVQEPEPRKRYTLDELTLSPADRERFELRGRIMAAIHDVVPDLGDREYEACADRVLSAALAGRQVVDLPAEPSFEIMADHLVVAVAGCTCDGGGEFPHRPECGYEPVMPLADLLTALERDGRTVVALPASDGTSYEGDPMWGAHVDYEDIIFACVNDGRPEVDGPIGDEPLPADVAEMYGLRLLAAAREARRLAAGSGSGEQHD